MGVRIGGDSGSKGSGTGSAAGGTTGGKPAEASRPTPSKAPATGKSGGTEAPASTGGPRQSEGAPAEHQSAFERAKSRRGSGGGNALPASDSPAAGLSSGKTAIQKARGTAPQKSALEALKDRSRKHNPNARVTENEIVADDSAMPGHGPSEVAAQEPEIEPLAPAPGETEIPRYELGSSVSDPVGDHADGTQEGSEIQDPIEVADPNAEPVEFTPKLKYKAFGQEHDIPERFRGLITDPESEREVHQVFERAHAMDRFKANYVDLDNRVKTQAVPEIQFHRKTRDEFNQLIGKNDVFGILGKMGMPREKVLQAVADRLRIEQLPPEQKALYDSREAAQATAEQTASQLQQMQARTQQLETHVKHSAIQSLFARGDVSTMANDFDTKMGKQGAFEDLVRDHGALMYSQGRDISPEEAVQAVMTRFGLQIGTAPANSQARVSSAQRTPAQAVRTQATPAKVIPNIASRAATTTQSKIQINSVADLRKLKSQNARR